MAPSNVLPAKNLLTTVLNVMIQLFVSNVKLV